MDDPVRDAGTEEDRHELKPRQADYFIVGWISFLAASLGTMLLFAWIDPQMLAEVAEPPLAMSRMTGYAVGFFFLWALCLLAGALCVYLIRTQHEQTPNDTDQS